MAESGEIWLNVAELARQVKRPERTVRRQVQQLAESDRQVRPNGRSVYNLAAFEALLTLMEPPKVAESGESWPKVAELSNAEPDAPGEMLNAEPEQSDLVKELLADIQFLRLQLQQRDVAESELRRLMLADKHELTELWQKVALLAAPDVAESKPDPPQGALQNLTEPDRSRPHLAETGREPPRRRWWEVWKRKE
jgi:hypothetical protein